MDKYIDKDRYVCYNIRLNSNIKTANSNNITKKYFIMVFLALSLTLGTPTYFARAESWWGEGYRPPEWVVSHGGTVVWYKIIGGQAVSERYGAIMEQNGKFVEDEEGRVMKFDDPKNGLYKVTALRGKKRLLSVEVFAHPGETIYITFNIEQKKSTVVSNYLRRSADPRRPVAIAPSAYLNSQRKEIVFPEAVLRQEAVFQELEAASDFVETVYPKNLLEVTRGNKELLQSLNVIP